MNKEYRQFAAFDIDGTIWPFDIEHEWLKTLVYEGVVSKGAIQRNRQFLRDHAAGDFEVDAYVALFYSYLSGWSRRRLESLAWRVFDRNRCHLHQEARDEIVKWLELSVPVFLLTAANSIAAEPIAKDVGVDRVVATELRFDDAGTFAGQIIPPYCYGSGKVEKAIALCQEKGWRLANGVYYADSLSDLLMLEAVGQPVVVNPQEEFADLVDARGWEIQRWGKRDAP